MSQVCEGSRRLASSPVWGRVPFVGAGPVDGVECDVVVVGLGGSGLAAVRRALGHGLSVAGVDRGSVSGAASGANGGFLLSGVADFYPQACRLWGADLMRRVYAQTVRVAGELYRLFPAECRNVGSVRVGDDPGDMAEHCEALRRDGFPAEPFVGREGVGVLLPSDGVFHPVRLSARQALDVHRSGAKLFTGCTVDRVEGRSVFTDRGVLHARRGVVVAVDGDVSRWASRPGVDSAHLFMVSTVPLGARVTDRAVYGRNGLDYYQQLPSGRVLIGGGRDVAEECGLGPAAESTLINGYLDGLVDRWAGSAAVDFRWSAPVGFTSDRRPVVEEISDGVWVLGGYNGTGNLVGRAAASSCVDSFVGASSSFAVWRELGQLGVLA